jgi:hypothetical protein
LSGGLGVIAKPDAVIMNSRTFGIPFNVDAAGNQPVEVQLLVSRGDSKWELLDRKPPQVKQFRFQGTDDGLFWFATRTVDSLGRPFPSGPLKPQLKVFIDTTKPEVTLNAEADASGRVDVALQMNDATPTKNVRLHYVTDVVRQWQIVAVQPLLATGKVSFVPNHDWQKLSLQTIVTDSAGNETVQSRLIHRPRVAKARVPRLTSTTPTENKDSSLIKEVAAPGDQSATTKLAQTTQPVNPSLPGYRVQTPGSVRSHLPMRGMTPESITRSIRGNLPDTRGNMPAATPFGPPSLYGNQSAYPTSPVTRSLPAPATPDEISAFSLNGPSGTDDEASVTPAPQPRRPRTAAEAMRPISEQSAVNKANSNGSPGRSDDRSQASNGALEAYKARRLSEEMYNEAIGRGRVPVRYSDSERFSLEYALEAIGANGVESVELYGSISGGKTWTLWGADPDRSTPFDIETKGEGVFGYRVVVVGRNGLASPRPLAGEVPDIIVVVDKTKPTVKLTSARYGAGDRTGSLVIGYEASDENLMTRPVALSFSDSVSGPWTTIAAGLRNDGMYVWPADPQLPRQIYLRMDVKDKAGNVGTYVLDQPIETKGLAPRARIQGFQSLSGNEQPGAGEQTAVRPRASFK